MLKKRIIPCLDIQDGRTVKGVNFKGIRDAGDPLELAEKYAQAGADELVFLDITATIEKRKTLVPLVSEVAKRIDIPFTVGGGINSVELAHEILNAGADKIAVNSAALKEPQLIGRLNNEVGQQAVVLAVDVKEKGDTHKVFVAGGRKATDWDALKWIKYAEELGAGEILLTSMDHDGTKNGFAISLLKKVCEICKLPIIASGGAGNIQHFIELFQKTEATAGLAASIFHYSEVEIAQLKEELNKQQIPTRL
jgi:cyclase